MLPPNGLPPGGGTTTNTKNPNKRTAKPKTVSELADAMERKALLKIREADGLDSFLKRSGVCL